jgi:hypothetical protein
MIDIGLIAKPAVGHLVADEAVLNVQPPERLIVAEHCGDQHGILGCPLGGAYADAGWPVPLTTAPPVRRTCVETK